jgi:hypothetical protein
MMKFERHKWHIEQHRTELIEDIMNAIVQKKAEKLELKSGIIFNAIDDQSNEVIWYVKNDGTVVLDCNGFEPSLKLSELSTDILISLLETIEKDKVSVSVEMNPEDYFWGKYKPEYNHVLPKKILAVYYLRICVHSVVVCTKHTVRNWRMLAWLIV